MVFIYQAYPILAGNAKSAPLPLVVIHPIYMDSPISPSQPRGKVWIPWFYNKLL
jgi:hypothetical protein